jgi:hypothetical protein
MFGRRCVVGVLVALGGIAAVASSSASQVKKAGPPRIVSVTMQDEDKDARAESVRVSYSVPIRHRLDRDGRYPFTVSGYRIRSVGTAHGRALVIQFVEHAKPDPSARPAIRYRWTKSNPVSNRAGVQAAAQLFRAVRPHRRTPHPATVSAPAPTPTTTTPTQTTPTKTPATPSATADTDTDHDGYSDDKDCGPTDAAIHPGAPDLPDLAFVDQNCDGIDGTEKDAIFASPNGNDLNPGTKQRPKRQIQAAAATVAAGNGKYVLAAAGSYAHVTALPNMAVYGGYDAGNWSRKGDRITAIVGLSEGLLADHAVNVRLQLLSVRGETGPNYGDNVYGIRAINGSALFLSRVTVTAGEGRPGAPGADGAAGRPGNPGLKGSNGACDHDVSAPGGAGGESPIGRDGGWGGDGHYESRGGDGGAGIAGTPGGKGGPAGDGHFVTIDDIDQSGEDGQKGNDGGPGPSSAGGNNSTILASTTGWKGRDGIEGIYGGPGEGGGGGGAGGGQTGKLVINGTGNGGGGGGGGDEGGRGGTGGRSGGGSFGVWLHSSTLVAEQSSISPGNGGAGGRGGNGGSGGAGGAGGPGNFYCLDEIGNSGAGGRGGNGGHGGGGGGGAGGPSIGIFKFDPGNTPVTLKNTKVTAGTAGPGGATGIGGGIFANPFPAEAGIGTAIYPA